MILPSDEEAAEKVTMELWRSRRGTLFTDEDTARWDGATHVVCTDCQAVTERRYSKCPACIEKAEIARHNAMPEEAWDEEGVIYSEVLDRYFESIKEASDEADNEGLKIKDLRLVICDPVYLRGLTRHEFYEQIPDDGELPDDVAQTIDDFNQVLREHGPIAWTPGNVRVKI